MEGGGWMVEVTKKEKCGFQKESTRSHDGFGL
jgi:hypothetical protein